jgi:predicted nuclease of predicted toxin-antitoxin system
VRLLLDQNLSPRLCELLRDLGDTVVHVRQLGLERADDATVRSHAAEHHFVIVTKDGDFNSSAFLFGAPPQIVWIRRGNCSTADVERILRAHHATIAAFSEDSNAAVMILE